MKNRTRILSLVLLASAVLAPTAAQAREREPGDDRGGRNEIQQQINDDRGAAPEIEVFDDRGVDG